MTYEEFRKEYEQQHPASVPVKPHSIQSEYPLWLRFAVLVMFICAALLSGVHTVPTVHAGIEASSVAPWVRDVVALASFVAVELAIFVAAYARLRGSRWTVTAMLIVTFIIALISNVNSVLKALVASGDLWTTCVGIVLGFGAPLITFMSGELFVHMHAAGSEADAKAWTTYREEMKQFDAMVLRDWRKASAQLTGRVQSSASERTGQDRTPADDAFVRPASTSLARTGFGYERTSDAQQKALDYFKANPDKVTLPLRTLEGLIGVGKSTIGEARQEWQRQLQLVQSVNGNGHGEVKQ